MSRLKQPWMKFYPADWRADPRLRMCSLSARGLWMEMLALMHEAEPYGHLVIAGQPPSDAQLSVLVGAPPDQIPDLVRELEIAGVFSRTREKVIYSRRMVSDEKKARISKKNGKNGGNPSLRKQRENSAWDNHQDKGVDKAQKPEARYQNNTEDKSSGAEAPRVTFEKEYFETGKRMLGAKAGGVLANLLKAKGSTADAYAVLMAASEAENPMEYVQGAMRERRRPPPQPARKPDPQFDEVWEHVRLSMQAGKATQ